MDLKSFFGCIANKGWINVRDTISTKHFFNLIGKPLKTFYKLLIAILFAYLYVAFSWKVVI